MEQWAEVLVVPEAEVLGIELSAPCLKLAAVEGAEQRLGNIAYRQADCLRSGLADGSFDLVTSTLALHWVNDLPGALIQIRMVLRPDGFFIGQLLGGATLNELRSCLIDAETEIRGGAAMRVSQRLVVAVANAMPLAKAASCRLASGFTYASSAFFQAAALIARGRRTVRVNWSLWLPPSSRDQRACTRACAQPRLSNKYPAALETADQPKDRRRAPSTRSSPTNHGRRGLELLRLLRGRPRSLCGQPPLHVLRGFATGQGTRSWRLFDGTVRHQPQEQGQVRGESST